MADEILPNSGMELPDIGGDQDTWGDILNENLRILDRAITLGAESIALAATDVTLDEDQATKGVLRLSGVLTANVNVVVPASPVRLYLVENNTTGAFTVAIKTPLGTGVTVLQGTSSLVYSNGTNVVQGATSVNGSFAVSGGFSAGSINNTPIGATTPNTGAFTNLGYTGTLTGGTGVLNIGSGQIYKDASGNVGIETASPAYKVDVRGIIAGGNGTIVGGISFSSRAEVGAISNHDLGLIANNDTKAILKVNGNFLVGGTTDAGAAYRAHFQNATNSAIRISAGSDYLDVGQFSNGGFIGTSSSDATLGVLRLGTANTERGRFTSSGYFKATNNGSYFHGTGTSIFEFVSNQANITVGAANTNTSASVQNVRSDLVTGSAGLHFLGVLNGVSQFIVQANGNVQNTNNSYGSISDAKLKNIIAPRDGKHYWEKFKRIKFWIYSLLADPTNQQLLGVVAQEFREIFPGLVNSSPDMHAVKKTREVTTEIQVTKPVQKEQIRTEIVSEGGRYVQKQITEVVTIDEPVFDQFPLYDETGALVMQLVSAEEPPQVDEKGEEISPAKPAVYAPVIHQVPRMTTVTTTEEYEEMEPNGEVTLSVNYSILGLIADTITQELQFRVEDLTARLEALEAQ